ncbi:MAG TPA: DNA ligase D [Thermoanaerobaculia bacterium]|jgi:bifunctional non-homologous end joining protein LigD|nr:DNA ligase D [Thermoanaerobaculia bacterium]
MSRSPEQLLRRVFPPMLATLTDAPPPDEKNWLFELKYDGFRAVAGLAGGDLALWSRNELDLAGRFPQIAKALMKIKGEMVLDGEIVALDAHGVPRFQLLQGGAHQEKLFVFDILWLEGKDLRRLPYEERRAVLEKTLKRPPAGIELAQQIDEPPEKALARAAKEGWEGLIAKRRGSVYETRRSKEWLKIKASKAQEMVIIGYQPSSASARDIGSLHLAYNKDGALHYAGKVGTGFSSKLRGSLREQLDRYRLPQSPAKNTPRSRDAIWSEPRLVAQVAFTEWTDDDRLRHPSFLGLRDDKEVSEVVKEKASKRAASSEQRAKPKTTAKRSSPSVNLTNPDRLLYPRDKITKQDVADYYEAVSGPMIQALTGRPLALEHWNQGIDKPSWFHQDVGREAPPWVTIAETPTRTASRKTVKHLVVDRPETLRWLAQMSVLTVHMWHAHTPKLSEADWILFDLDPAKGKGIEQAIEAAIIMRGLLENLELPSYPKTSGKRGIHVLVPLAPGYTHEQANEFACNIAAAVASNVAGITVERSLSKRRGRLYLDCMQNAYGKTVVAPYSLRAIDGAPVSAPLKWEEVTKKLDPLKFNLRTMPARLAKVGDLFAPVLEGGVKLPALK